MSMLALEVKERLGHLRLINHAGLQVNDHYRSQ